MLAKQRYASIHTLRLDLLGSGIVSMIDGLRDELNIAGDYKPDYLKKIICTSSGPISLKGFSNFHRQREEGLYKQCAILAIYFPCPCRPSFLRDDNSGYYCK